MEDYRFSKLLLNYKPANRRNNWKTEEKTDTTNIQYRRLAQTSQEIVCEDDDDGRN